MLMTRDATAVSTRRTLDPLAALLLLLLAACAPVYVAPASETTPAAMEAGSRAAPPDGIVYVLGDIGEPTSGFVDVTRAIAEDLAADHARGPAPGASPLLVALGDNLYPTGLPRIDSADPASIARLARLAELLAACRFGDDPAPLVLVPGNHDYHNQALGRDRTTGDVTRWYYLDALGIDDIAHWTMRPGERPTDVADAASLYDRLYRGPDELAAFMRPRPLPDTPASVAIVAFDSQLLLDLLATGRDDLADEYLDALEEELTEAASARWRIVAMHHPLQSYGSHRVATPGRFLFGPGWPQFPSAWQVPLAVPPLGTLFTTIKWAMSDRQDMQAPVNRDYRRAVLDRLLRLGDPVPLVLSGHDHNAQLIELGPVEGGRTLVQVVTGAAARRNPVARGRGTRFYHSGHGYVRLAAYPTHLEIAFRDRSGATLYRHRLEHQADPSASATTALAVGAGGR